MAEFPAEDEPDGDVHLPHHYYLGLILATYGFILVWPTYPVTGSTLAIIGILIAVDDILSHAFGVWTPLDWAYRRFLRRWIP